MSEEKLTPWFPGNVKPVRKGVYQRRAGFLGSYSYWNGRFWCLGDNTPLAAKDSVAISYASEAQSALWRGLAQDTKAKP